MRATHLYSGLVLGVFSLVLLFWVIPSQTSPADSPLDLPPAFMPTVAVVVCLLLSILMSVNAWRTPAEDSTELHEEFGEEATGMGPREFRNLAIWIGAAAFTWFGTVHIGFEPVMIVYLAAALYFAGVRNYVLLAVVAIVVPIFLSQFAGYLFNTEVPAFWRG